MKMKMKFSLLLSFLSLATCQDAFVKDYLSEFGFYNPNAFETRDISESLSDFQMTFDLSVTGRADNETLALMATPRCGRPDNEMEGKGFAYYTPKWRKKDLTYYFHSYTKDLYRDDLLELTAKAFKFWSDVTPLTFRRVESGGDIVIAFGEDTHGDDKRPRCSSPFDGKGKVLAHAYYPEDGRLHFDDAEKFAKSRWTWRGTNYVWVAVHEIGHNLGLSHDTKDESAIMYPYYRSFNSNMKLSQSDIDRIRQLYGSR